MFDIALGIFLLVSPIFFMPMQVGNINALQFYQFGVLGNSGYNFMQLLFFYFAAVALFIIAMLSEPQRKFNDKWAVILFLSYCVSLFIHPIGIKMFGSVLMGMLLYYLVTVYTKNYKKLYKFIFAISLLNTVFAVLQFFKIYLIYTPNGRVDGLMCLFTHLGVYQVIALPICYVLNPALIIIPIIGVVLSKSITAITIMFVWLIIKFAKRIISGGFLVVNMLLGILVYFIIHNWHLIIQKINIRLYVWIPTIKQIFQHLFDGHGIKPFLFQHSIGLYESPCSIYLSVIHQLGVLAVIPILMIIRRILSLKGSPVFESLIIVLFVGIEKPIFDFSRLTGTIIVLFAFLGIMKGELQNVNQV